MNPAHTQTDQVPTAGRSAVPGQSPVWISFFAGLAGLYALLYTAIGSGVILGYFSAGRLIKMLPLALITTVILLMIWSGLPKRLARAGWLIREDRHPNPLAAVGFWLVWLIFPLVTMTRVGEAVLTVFPRVWIFSHLVLVGAILWQLARPGRKWWDALAISLVAYAGLYKLVTFFPDVQTYPFSLGWSEASRFYYASLFRSDALYGASLPLPTLHPSRYLLQAVPWLIPSLPLWFHRLWQVLLWLGFTLVLALAVGRRFPSASRIYRLTFVVWAALFVFQGPVYYHLAVVALPVLLGFDGKKPWRSLFWIVAASLWAGISRINWIPLPGSLAALLYFLEEPARGKRLLNWAAPAAGWVAAGTAAGLAAQWAYTQISGNPAGQFNSSLTSDLLWYRLFPSATYPLGVLPGVILASAGLAGILFVVWQKTRGDIHLLRWLGVAAILGIFFLGGLVVSVKIGGGSNLHNLDAYLVLLLAAGSAAWAGALVTEQGLKMGRIRLAPVLVALALLAPVLPVIQGGLPVALPSMAQAQKDLSSLQQYLDAAGSSGGEVLFITERHLIPFEYVKGVRLEPDYEKVFLMEMVMAGNRPYLEQFWQDLRLHRFDLIITEPLSTSIQDRSHGFSEENNVWVEGVSIPLLETYQQVGQLEASGVWIMAPR